MQKEFTKADLKDGMVVEYRDGKRRLVLNNRLIGKDGYYELNKYTEDMKDKEFFGRDIMRVFKIVINTTLSSIFHIENLELIWGRVLDYIGVEWGDLPTDMIPGQMNIEDFL